MRKFFLYAETGSIARLDDCSQHKVILIGGDLGFPNFGDILQLKGTIQFHQKWTGLIPVPVYSIDSISNANFVEKMKAQLGVETILFFSEKALEVEFIDFTLVSEIKKVSSLHLYGGGFLNGFWGQLVLDLAEHFLIPAPTINYVASGHQVGSEIKERLLDHIERFKPSLFAVRDFDSLNLLESWGKNVRYSFDDAYEEIVELAAQIRSGSDSRIIGHINLSDYTSEDYVSRRNVILKIFGDLYSNFPDYKLTVVNAYSDMRVNVIDSLASLVQLETEFPYQNYSIVELATAAYSGTIADPELLNARLAVSCSYHVTMLLHMAGIPCWLVAGNAFYDQKSRALNPTSSYEEFIADPQIPDYTSRIGLRKLWLEELQKHLKIKKHEACDINFLEPQKSQIEKFKFKLSGMSDLKEQLLYLKQQIHNKDSYIEEMQRDKKWFLSQLESKESYILELLAAKKWLEDELAKQISYSRELESNHGQLNQGSANRKN